MSFVIRPAQISDWQVLRDYNCALARETESKQLDPETVASGVRAALADPRKGRYFVAESEGRVVGQVMHTYEWSDWRNGDIWWLQSVYVHPDFRRQGVFRALLQHVLAEAHDDPHVVGVRLYVEDHNNGAQATYAQSGLIPAGYLVLEKMFRSGDRGSGTADQV